MSTATLTTEPIGAGVTRPCTSFSGSGSRAKAGPLATASTWKARSSARVKGARSYADRTVADDTARPDARPHTQGRSKIALRVEAVAGRTIDSFGCPGFGPERSIVDAEPGGGLGANADGTRNLAEFDSGYSCRSRCGDRCHSQQGNSQAAYPRDSHREVPIISMPRYSLTRVVRHDRRFRQMRRSPPA